jgi:hypothetical protein
VASGVLWAVADGITGDSVDDLVLIAAVRVSAEGRLPT